MALAAIANRPGNHALRKNDPGIAREARSRSRNKTVLAGSARADDEDQRAALRHGIQANA